MPTTPSVGDPRIEVGLFPTRTRTGGISTWREFISLGFLARSFAPLRLAGPSATPVYLPKAAS